MDTPCVLEISKMTPQWLAGFFDGEGCVTARMRQGVMKLAVSISQSDLQVMEAIGRLFRRPVKVVCRSRRVCYGITFSGHNCLPFLRYIEDFVVVKRPQVLLAIELAKLVGNAGPVSSEGRINHKKRAELGDKIRMLNQSVNKFSGDVNGGYLT
jgi:hypothetical protein